MKMHGLTLGFSMMCVTGAVLADDKKNEPQWEIVTRTLAHAPDGSPDSRKQLGIGEWVELRVVPETISNVEWIIKGSAMVSNRFGNPTILMSGYTRSGSGFAEGKISIEAIVHDEPQAALPASKKTRKDQGAAQSKRESQRAELASLSVLAASRMNLMPFAPKYTRKSFSLSRWMRPSPKILLITSRLCQN